MRVLRRVLAIAFLVALAHPPAIAAPPHEAPRWAVIVGTDHYQGRTHPTVGSVGDANDYRQVLLRSGWPADHIRMVIESGATQAGIRAAFQWLRDRASSGSYSVFHYSGHVKQTGGHEYLWPYDNRFIADTELGAAMRAVPGWLWVDIAGCEGAGFNEGISAPNRLFTASSRANEKSYEYPRWKNSVYGGLLADQGVLQGKADANRDGRVSVHEAFRYAAAQAPQMTGSQPDGPQHPVIAGGDGKEWFFDAPPAPKPAPAPAPAGGSGSGSGGDSAPPPRKCFPLCIG